jgi:hypothetical protein
MKRNVLLMCATCMSLTDIMLPQGSQSQKTTYWAGGCSSVIECMLSMHEALSPVPSTHNNNKRPHIVCFHFYELSRIHKSTEAKVY